MRNVRTCGEALVALLEKYDVDKVFGIPGVHTLELYRGLVNSRIRHVLPRHEQGAGFMADGYARATGKPGVCFLITGPGVTNAATAIGQAYSDSVPMLVISSVNPAATLGRGRGELHELKDQQALMSGCTAFSARAEHPHQIPALFARAFALFARGRPRPVHIEVPIDIFDREVEEEWLPEPLPPVAMPAEPDVAQAAAWLASARNPAILVGGGAKAAGAAVLEIAEKLAAPVACSVGGLGVFPGSHALSLGPTLVSAATRQLLGEADVVLVAGCEIASTDTWGPAPDFRGKLIRVDIDANQFDHPRQADLAIRADARVALEAIAARLEAKREAALHADAARKVAETVAAWRDHLGPGDRLRKAVFEAIEAASPPDTVFTADMTQIAYTSHTIFTPDEPGRYFYPQGYGTLGFALPAAMGVKLAKPATPVVCLIGDGGILYTLTEMATAVDENIPIVVALWNNNSLQQIREGFEERGIEPIAVSPRAPDFQTLARGFGWETAKVSSMEAIGPAIAAALASGRPSLVEIDALALAA